MGLSQPRITQIIKADKSLESLATNKIKLTSVNEWLSGKKQVEVAKLLGVSEALIF